MYKFMTLTTDYILNDIKPIKVDEKIDSAQAIFEQNQFSHFPVLDKDIFCGNIAKEDIEFTDFGDKTIQNIKNRIAPFYVSNRMNWFEILQNFATHNTNVLPILDAEKKYIGYYELDDFLNIFKCTPFLHEEGVILVVSKNVNEYSFSQISQIVESNNATLFGAFVSKIENDIAQITLKLSLHDINNTLHSFRRYNYQILNEFEKDKYLEELNNRSDYLQKYLNI
ncbi:MAG: acetoin utilization protein acuB [Flavobacteriaceae bacterium]|nr:acetoin utilization protein acuB [Flavobacteriaceae bacterium]